MFLKCRAGKATGNQIWIHSLQNMQKWSFPLEKHQKWLKITHYLKYEPTLQNTGRRSEH